MVSMVAQEGAPGLAGRAGWPTPAIASNRAVADHDAQLEELTSDALGAPQPVLARHSPDQVLHLGTQMRTAATRAGLPAPEQAPAPPMPAHNPAVSGVTKVRCSRQPAPQRRARIHSSLSHR